MKIRSLLCGLFAIAAISACKPDEPVVQPSLDVNKTSALVSAAGEELTIEVTSNVDWTASADQDWVSVNPSSGKGSADAAKVKVTVDPNEAEETRAAVVTVVADQLTKTLKITQSGADAPEPETYILVGEAIGGWDVDANGITLVLEDGYYVAKAVSVTAKKGMHFTKNAAWEGNVKGKHGLIAPNEIGEVGSNDISLTEGGKFDVYLTEALDKFYFMSEGKLPSEAVEHVDIAVSWGICGAYGNNNWGSGDPDTELVQDGEWYVAKNIEFSEVNFKIRGNNSWADDVKWGRAAKDQKCELNKAIAVSTCTEYKEANPDAGDNENIYIGGSGTYDVYFSPEKKEVWVMTPGYKPGDETPEITVTYTVTGTIKGTDADKKANYWNPSNEPGLMVEEDGYLVAKNIEFDYDYRFSDDASGENYVKFKICETGTWNAFGQLEDKAVNKPNTEITVKEGGHDIYLDRAGLYDVYLDKTNGKVWVMEAGYKPGEEIARLNGNQWIGEFDDMPVLFDLGIAQDGMLSVALPTMDETGFALHMIGFYEIEAADKASGVILFMQYDWEWDEIGEEFEIQYSELTANSVKVVCENIFGVSDPITLTRVESPYEIIPPGGGGDSPEGPIADGGYWLVNSGKVMAPLAEDATSGVFPAEDMINYASTVRNTLTFTYDPDFTAYTIQDSYGRYIGQTDWESGNASLTTVLPQGEDYTYYLWVVDNSYDDGTVDVYNLSTYFGIGYSAENNNWYLTEETYDNGALRPFVVSAEFPVEEPQDPEIPSELTEEKVIWEGSHNTGGWSGNQDLAWDGFDWSTVKAGCKLKLYVTPNNPSSDWWCISLRSAAEGWPNLAGIPAQYDKPSYSITLDLTQALLDEIKTGNGLIFTGSETTVTKISLLPADAEVSIWEGSMTSNGYSNCLIGTVNDWINNGTAPGDKVRIYVTGGEGWALQIYDPQWKKWFGTGSDGSQEGLYGHGFNSYNSSLDKGYLEFDITAEMAATIASYTWGNALIIQGDKIEVTKISIL